MKKISAIILTQNNQFLLPGCLESLEFTDELIVIDTGSTDKTLAIANQYQAKVITHDWKGFSKLRNLGAEKAEGEWLLYVDSDERVSPELKRELSALVSSGKAGGFDSYRIPRKNYLLGKWLKHGDWYPEPQLRFIRKSVLRGWTGKLHESPAVDGEIGLLAGHLIHLTHRDIGQMLTKTIQYTQLEAELRLEAGHPRVRAIHLFSAPAREFWRRGIKAQGWRDGIEGIIEIIYQAFNQFLIMVRLWEMQRDQSLEKTYRDLDGNLEKENRQ